jgi:hypothetical protein
MGSSRVVTQAKSDLRAERQQMSDQAQRTSPRPQLIVHFEGAFVFLPVPMSKRRAMNADIIVLAPETRATARQYMTSEEHTAQIHIQRSGADGPEFVRHPLDYVSCELGAAAATDNHHSCPTCIPTLGWYDVTEVPFSALESEMKKGNAKQQPPWPFRSKFVLRGGQCTSTLEDVHKQYTWEHKGKKHQFSNRLTWSFDLDGPSAAQFLRTTPLFDTKQSAPMSLPQDTDGNVIVLIAMGSAMEHSQRQCRMKISIGDPAPDFHTLYGPIGRHVGEIPVLQEFKAMQPKAALATQKEPGGIRTVSCEICTGGWCDVT